jgi:hypothetical protein
LLTIESAAEIMSGTTAPQLLASESSGPSAELAQAVQIGSRRELFVDCFLIDRLIGGAALRLSQPRDEGVAFPFDRPWEGCFSAYVTVVHDGNEYRAYYRGVPVALAEGSAAEVTCLAQSSDGIHWTKPTLGLFEVAGCTDNNVVLAGTPPFSHNFTPLVDARPAVKADERYKALAGTEESGLVAFVSGDGVRWRRLCDQPVITGRGFGSQNVAFWSAHEQAYVSYFRTFKHGIRRISRSTSPDFLSWSEPVVMEYGDKPIEHMYTNQTQPYFRAPHLYVSIAARYMHSRRVLTVEQAWAINVDQGYSADCSDGVFMTTRGDNRYDRSLMEGFLCPGIGPEHWVSRTNFPALGVIPTGNSEMSIYVNERYGQASAHLRRYSLRMDGFASAYAPYGGGEILTKPLVFTGKELLLNVATSAAGSVHVEVQDSAGAPLAGFELDSAVEIVGNDLDRVARWTTGADLSRLAGTPIRLRFVLKDAHLYSMRFC